MLLDTSGLLCLHHKPEPFHDFGRGFIMSGSIGNGAAAFPARVRLYRENRSRFRPEQLLPYAGQWVAFSADGKQIVASDEAFANLEAKLSALGMDPQDVLFEQIDGYAVRGEI
jgi:hypothetical protein